jgi:hypothetical protein
LSHGQSTIWDASLRGHAVVAEWLQAITCSHRDRVEVRQWV